MNTQRNTVKDEQWGQIKSLLINKYNSISETHIKRAGNANDSWEKLKEFTGITRNQLDNTTTTL